MALANKPVFHILCASGPDKKPTITKVNTRGFLSESKASSEADRMAKSNPGNRYYVVKTVKGFMKRPEVTSKSY